MNINKQRQEDLNISIIQLNRKVKSKQQLKMRGKSIFLSIVGDSPKARVLDFLLMFPKFDYSLTEIARNAEVGYTTLQMFWEDFVKNKIVIQTRTIGKAKLFKLNEDNPVVKELLSWSWNLTKLAISRKYPTQKIKVKV